MTFEKYQRLTDRMLNEYLEEWPEWDIVIPSFEQAQEQERVLLENKTEGKGKMRTKIENLGQKIKEIFGGRSEREDLDEKISYRETEEEKRAENAELTFAEKAMVRETFEEEEEIDHTLDTDFEDALGSGRDTRLRELKESFGSESEGMELLESVKIDLMDGAGNGVFKFSGRAFQTDVINSNGRRYSRNITEGALRENRGGTLSVISGHPGKNDSDPSKVVGKVVFAENLDPNGWVTFQAQLSNTTLGKDLQILLIDKTIGDVSLRSRGHTKQVIVDGETIEEVTALRFKGLDLVREGSFQGAKVDRIFN
ncbi:hypothetical protein KAV79_04420 [Candidatus Aerophobetes bacterium]|nr:hypothetical protein [Candidatus Aerophobetes bacterium]